MALVLTLALVLTAPRREEERRGGQSLFALCARVRKTHEDEMSAHNTWPEHGMLARAWKAKA